MYVDLIIMNRPQPRQLITFETIFCANREIEIDMCAKTTFAELLSQTNLSEAWLLQNLQVCPLFCAISPETAPPPL